MRPAPGRFTRMAFDPWLIVILLAAIAFIVASTAKLRLHPCLALLLTAYGVGLAAGMPVLDVATTVSEGFGGLLAKIGLVIVAGTIIGAFLEKSGAAVVLAETVLRVVGENRPGLAMSLIGYVVSIPVFCDSAFVILASLNRALARRTGVSLTSLAVALGTGLYATHVLVPPTPGPLAAAANLGAMNLGLVLVVGLVVAVPPMLAGWLWSRRFAARFDPGQREEAEGDSVPDWEGMKARYGRLPRVWASFAPIVVPILLIALASVAALPGAPLGGGRLRTALLFVGTPITALLVGVALCFLLVERIDRTVLGEWVGDALKDAAVILVVTGAGGSLGKMLAVTKIGDSLSGALAGANLGIFLPFVIAAAIKTAQGSSTVALVTASTLVAPLLGPMGLDTETGRVLAVMAVATGSMVVSHANDSYFWVLSQFSRMEVATAYRAHTTATLLQGVVGIGTVWVLSWIL